MPTYYVTSGECYEVEANSEDEALAIFHVSQGNEDQEFYAGEGFNLDEDSLNSVQWVETQTVAEAAGW